MSAYLRIAYSVLKRARCPLSSREILEAAYRFQLVPQHLYGKTQHKTLQARLSEDLLYNRANTELARTGPGQFCLKSMVEKENEKHTEYIPHLRSYQLKQFQVFCAKKQELSSSWGSKAIKCFGAISHAFVHQSSLRNVEGNSQLVHLRLFVVIRHFDRLLALSSVADNDSRRSLGMVGYVKTSDVDLFSSEPFGIDRAARRTIAEQINATHQSIEELSADNLNSYKCYWPKVGVLAQHVLLIATYDCENPEKFLMNVARNRNPTWMPMQNATNGTNELDTISEKLIGLRKAECKLFI